MSFQDFLWTQTENGWIEHLGNSSISPNLTIHNLDAVNSASEIETEQYLALRILWKRSTNITDNSIRTLLGYFYTKAQSMLAEREAFNSYWSAVKDRSKYGPGGMNPQLGEFAQVLMDQNEVSARKWKDPVLHNKITFSPAPNRPVTRSQGQTGQTQTPPKPLTVFEETPVGPFTQSKVIPISPRHRGDWRELYPKSNDEEIVNVALLSFLKALIVFSFTFARWTNARPMYRVNLANGTYYQARTDGCLRGLRTDRTRAIVEVKPVTRDSALIAISQQEGAQMAAWICCESFDNENWDLEGQKQ